MGLIMFNLQSYCQENKKQQQKVGQKKNQWSSTEDQQPLEQLAQFNQCQSEGKIKQKYIFKIICFLACIWFLVVIIALTVRSILDNSTNNQKLQIEPNFYSYNPDEKVDSSIKDGISIGEMREKYSRLIVQFFNNDKNGTNFNFAYKLPIDEKMNESSKDYFNFDSYGIFDHVQVGSDFDHLKIGDKINFTQLQSFLLNSIPYELISFKKDESLQVSPNKQVNLSRLFQKTFSQFDLAARLTIAPDNLQNIQAQYLYYHNKYKIGHQTSQTSICIVATGHQIFSKNKYKLFFDSMERQNYTNFHIVYIDDNSSDQSAYKIFDYLNQKNSRITNRIKIVHNLQYLGKLANLFFWVKKYCGDQDIVAVVDAHDSLIGRQALKVINALFQNSQRWYSSTRYIEYKQNQLFSSEVSRNFQGTAESYRINLNIWTTSHLKTWRKKLTNVVPIQHFIQFYYSQSEKSAYPRFYDSSTERFQVYTLIQLAGTDRLTFTTDYLYLHDATADFNLTLCSKLQQKLNELKSRMKTPLVRLQNFNDTAKYAKYIKVPKKLLQNLRDQYTRYQKCLLTTMK